MMFNPGLAAELRCAVVYCMFDNQKHHRCRALPITDSHACAGSHAGANSAARALHSRASFLAEKVKRCY